MAEGEQGPEYERPTGEALLGWGWSAIMGGLLLGLIGLAMDATDYSGIDPETFALKVAALIISAALLNIGAFLAMGGIIVRALWFLPGRTWTAAPAPAPVPASPPVGHLERQAELELEADEEEEEAEEARDPLDVIVWIISIVGLILLGFVGWDLARRFGG